MPCLRVKWWIGHLGQSRCRKIFIYINKIRVLLNLELSAGIIKKKHFTLYCSRGSPDWMCVCVHVCVCVCMCVYGWVGGCVCGGVCGWGWVWVGVWGGGDG